MAWNLDQIPVVCLNLDRRVDSWERVQNSPGFADFPRIERWSGTDGKTLDITNDPRISLIVKYNVANKTRRAHEYINTPGAVGCYLSHASVYEWMAKQNNADVVLIFEDDIDLPAGCYAALKEYIAKTPLLQDSSKWDMWQLGANIAESSTAEDGVTRDVTAFVLAHAYFVSKRGADRLMSHLYPLELHVDGYMSYMAKLGLMKIYASPNYIFYQGGSKSDIYPGHDCPMCDIPSNFTEHSEIISKRRKRMYQLEDGVLKAAAAVAALYGIWWVMSGPKRRGNTK